MHSPLHLPPAHPDGACIRHGYALHGFVHEAGHAVIADHHSISFDSVSVARKLGAPDPSFGDTVAGGLDMGLPAGDWVPNDPVCALEVLAAGMAAETAPLGDHLRHGYAGDIIVWRRGTGLTDGLKSGGEAATVLSHALGEPFGDVVRRAQALVQEKLAQVAMVAMAIHGSPDWRLTEEEVLAILSLDSGRRQTGTS